MLLGPLSQAQSFLAALYGGAALCLCWEIARGLRLALGAGRLVTALCDAVFSLCVFAVLLGVLILSTGGEMRPYLFLGVLLGGVLCETALGRFTRKLSEKLFGMLSRKIRQCARHPAVKRLFR